jgi:uncharacterized membrane protein
VETVRRSIVKALSWRITATLITTTLVYLLTGEMEFAAKVGLADTVIKFAFYFGHERLWNKLPYGRQRTEPEYYI